MNSCYRQFAVECKGVKESQHPSCIQGDLLASELLLQGNKLKYLEVFFTTDGMIRSM